MARVRGKCLRMWIGMSKRMLGRKRFVPESAVEQTFVPECRQPIVHKPNIGYIDPARCADLAVFAAWHGLNGLFHAWLPLFA